MSSARLLLSRYRLRLPARDVLRARRAGNVTEHVLELDGNRRPVVPRGQSQGAILQPTTLRRRLEKPHHRVGKRARVIGQENVRAVLDVESFRAW